MSPAVRALKALPYLRERIDARHRIGSACFIRITPDSVDLGPKQGDASSLKLLCGYDQTSEVPYRITDSSGEIQEGVIDVPRLALALTTGTTRKQQLMEDGSEEISRTLSA